MRTDSIRHVAILGSTGSIGTQALEVIAANPGHFCVEILTAHKNADLLIMQARQFKPNAVVITDESLYAAVKEALRDEHVKVYAGIKSVCELMEMDSLDIVLAAMVGFAGLEPVLSALRNKKPVALANKETLVVAGDLVSKLALENRTPLLPVDSEHSAIFQCLMGEAHNEVEKIILTASGGPFRGRTKDELASVTRAQALKHPNWNMGDKVTIDSATLMNKGLEMIEARWLFDLQPSQIEVIVHPQSVIHSIVQFTDGSMKAQMGLPDMKLPIQVAMAYPNRLYSAFPRFDFTRYPQLTFEQADENTFGCLALARQAMEAGGNMPCIMNAANEIAVAAFLREELSFLQVPELIAEVMSRSSASASFSFDEYRAADAGARRLAAEYARVKKSLPSAHSS